MAPDNATAVIDIFGNLSALDKVMVPARAAFSSKCAMPEVFK